MTVYVGVNAPFLMWADAPGELADAASALGTAARMVCRGRVFYELSPEQKARALDLGAILIPTIDRHLLPTKT